MRPGPTLPNARDKFIVIVMAFEIHKLRQVVASVFVVLALCVSSVSACACAHHSHPEKVEVVEAPSCHQQAHHEEAASEPAIAGSADASCECVLQGPAKVFVKSEKLKIEKQAVAATRYSPVIDLETPAAPSVSPIFYSPRSLLSRDFENLRPARAPPRL